MIWEIKEKNGHIKKNPDSTRSSPPLVFIGSVFFKSLLFYSDTDNRALISL